MSEPQAEGLPRFRLRQRQESQVSLAGDLGQNRHRIEGQAQYRIFRYSRSFCLRVQAHHNWASKFFAVSSTAPSMVRQLDLLIGVNVLSVVHCFPRFVEDSYRPPKIAGDFWPLAGCFHNPSVTR